MAKSYLNLIKITLLVTCISYVVEFFYPCINTLPSMNKIGFFMSRFTHFLYFIYFISFLYLFNYKSNDAIVYITLAIIMMSSWKILDCCILSYYELKMYNVSHYDFLTTFHPCLYSIFRKYQEHAITAMGIIMTFTYYYVLIKNKRIPLIYKLFLGLIFSYFFIDNLVQTRYYKKSLKYPEDKSHVLYKYF